jgi:hypothetical protein
MTTSTTIILPSQQSETSLFQVAYNQELARLQDQAQMDSIFEARDLITSVLYFQWEEHLWPTIKVSCDLTTSQLRDIGRLPRAAGTVACRRLVRVPVIHDQVAEGLWEFLAACQGQLDGTEDDAQEDFERCVVAEMADENGYVEEHSTWCESKARLSCQPASDDLEERGTLRTVNLEGTFWQREEAVCPCQRTYKHSSEEGFSNNHGSEPSAEDRGGRSSSSPASTFSSSRSSFSQVFRWGRRDWGDANRHPERLL